MKVSLGSARGERCEKKGTTSACNLNEKKTAAELESMKRS
jgi:hypothetical protein